MSKKIALSLGFAALVSMTAASGASAMDRSAMVEAIQAGQANARLEIVQMVAKSRATGLPIKAIALEGRVQAKQAQTRVAVARLIEESRQQNIGLVNLAYAERAQQTELAKKDSADASLDIDG